jgi:hypothetical protein
MNRAILGLGAVASAATAMMFFGAGTAVADEVGQTYADASETWDEDGVDPIIATRVGDTLEQDDCIVTAAWTPPFIRDAGDEFTHSSDEVLVSLNCAGAVASPVSPGASAGSPAGMDAKGALKDAAETAQEAGLEVSEENGVTTIDGTPCMGHDYNKCLGLAEEAAG